MSMENAILELAAAIRALAASNLATAGSPEHARAYEHAQHEAQMDRLVVAEKAQLEQAVTKVETDAKAEQKKVMAQVEADRKPSTAKEAIAEALAKAKAEALAKAKAEKEAAAAPVVEEDSLDTTPLDYEKDVKPKLIAVGKDKSALVALLASMDVGAGKTYAKADQLPVAKFGEIVAAADAILAARG